MARSQRHNLENYGSTSSGHVVAQGQIAPSILAQNEVTTPAMNEVKTITPKGPSGGGWTVPEGPSGGPLQGSSLSGAIPAGAPQAPTPGPDPAPGEEPVLNSINPSACAIGDDDLTLNVTGNRFTDTTLIYFNGGAESTVFVNDGKVTTIVKPSLATVPIDVPVWVQQGSYQSNSKTFSFKQLTSKSAEREFPIGPFGITAIEDHDAGVSVALTDASQVQVGDTVLLEATGNTSVNGSYEVLSIEGNAVVVDNAIVLTASIEDKGRLTVIGGA